MNTRQLFLFVLIGIPISQAEVKFFLPKTDLPLRFDNEITRIVQTYNDRHPNHPTVLVRKGSRFSTLKELMAARVTASLPDLAVIAESELEAALPSDSPSQSTAIIQPFSRKRFSKLHKKLHAQILKPYLQRGKRKQNLYGIPFLMSSPVLLVNQEFFFRHYLPWDQSPTRWKPFGSLLQKVQTLSEQTPTILTPIHVPMLGPEGIWILEHLAGNALWERKQGGVRAKEQTPKRFTKILNRFSRDPRVYGKSTKEALKNFSQSAMPLSATLFHEVTQGSIPFRWTFSVLPTLDGAPTLTVDGSMIVITQKGIQNPAVQKFLLFLYGREMGHRWSVATGFLPIFRNWKLIAKKDSALSSLHPQYLRWVSQLQRFPVRFRQRDREILKIRARWENALSEIFGQPLENPKTPRAIDPQEATRRLSRPDLSF